MKVKCIYCLRAQTTDFGARPTWFEARFCHLPGSVLPFLSLWPWGWGGPHREELRGTEWVEFAGWAGIPGRETEGMSKEGGLGGREGCTEESMPVDVAGTHSAYPRVKRHKPGNRTCCSSSGRGNFIAIFFFLLFHYYFVSVIYSKKAELLQTLG